MIGRRPDTQNGPASTPAARRAKALQQFVVEEIEIGPVHERAAPARRVRPGDGWREDAKLIATWLGLWLLLVLATLFARSPWPTDETRLLAVAWEMWQARSFFLPTVNGVPYAQAPLVPWLMHAGWAALGVVEWWARLVPLLGGLLSLLLTWRIARNLWPQHADVARCAPLVLLGTLAWSAGHGLALAQPWLVAAVLLGVWALLIVWRRRDHRAWLLLALATALGLLAQGWVFTLYVYPVAVLAPLWAREGRRPQWGYWYLDLLKALVAGAVPIALWLLAIGWRFGWTSVYELTLRAPPLPILDALPLRPEPWWYAAWIPLVFLPWSVWPIVWLRHWQLRRVSLNAGLWFCLVWVVTSAALLAAVPGAQAQWLLPLLPAGALVVTFLALDEALRGADENRLLAAMTLPVVLLGGATMVMPKLPRADWAPEFLWDISPGVGLGIMVVGVALAWLPVRATRRRLADMAVASAMAVVLASLALGWQLDALWRIDGTAQFLAQAEHARRPIAQVGDYHGEYHYAGRLTRPIAVIPAAHVPVWAAANPDGVVVAASARWRPTTPGARLLHEAAYRDSALIVWDASSLTTRGAPAAPDS